MDAVMFAAATLGYAVGSFRDPAIILFAVICAGLGRSKVRLFWPLVLSMALTAFGAFMAYFVWQIPSGASQWLGPALFWRFYINCVIGYFAYGFGRILFRGSTAGPTEASNGAP